MTETLVTTVATVVTTLFGMWLRAKYVKKRADKKKFSKL